MSRVLLASHLASRGSPTPQFNHCSNYHHRQAYIRLETNSNQWFDACNPVAALTHSLPLLPVRVLRHTAALLACGPGRLPVGAVIRLLAEASAGDGRDAEEVVLDDSQV